MDHEDGPSSIRFSAAGEFGRTKTHKWRCGGVYGRRVGGASSYQLFKGAFGNDWFTRIKHGSTIEASRGRNNT